MKGALEDFGGVFLRGNIIERLRSAVKHQDIVQYAIDPALTYYFSTHGWSRLESSLFSPALDLELLDAATAAARALLLKNEAAMIPREL